MPDIFINYRTGDVEHAAAAIDRDLSHRFGSERVFYAGKTIPGGQNFRTELLRGARTCSVLLALIGPGWLAADAEGAVALFDTGDWVRREILEAFGAGARVIPVLVGRRTERLKPTMLPKQLRLLGDCQSVPYDHRTAEHDLSRLSELITTYVPSLVDRTAPERPRDPEPSATGSITKNENHGGIQNSSAGRDIFHGRDHISTQESGVGYMAGGSIGTVVNRSQGPCTREAETSSTARRPPVVRSTPETTRHDLGESFAGLQTAGPGAWRKRKSVRLCWIRERHLHQVPAQSSQPLVA